MSKGLIILSLLKNEVLIPVSRSSTLQEEPEDSACHDRHVGISKSNFKAQVRGERYY